MKLVRPFTITSSVLTSNVSDGSEPEYSAAATYLLGQVVRDTAGASATNHLYESLIAGNVGNPLTNELFWLDVGPTNRMAMFDQKNSTATTRAGGIDVSIAVKGRTDALALLGLAATSIRVIATTVVLGTVFDKTFNMQSDSGINNWYDWFSEDVTYATDLVILDLPLYTDLAVRVVVTNTTGTAAVGTFVLGHALDLGGTLYGASAGILDYSRKETDDFGNIVLVERAYAKRASITTTIDASKSDFIADVLASFRATPAIWIGAEDYRSTWIFGFARDWSVEQANLNTARVSASIEGLT